MGGCKLQSINRIENLKKSIKTVEALPLFQRPAHLMPLVNELIDVLEQHSKDIAQHSKDIAWLKIVAEHVKTRETRND